VALTLRCERFHAKGRTSGLWHVHGLPFYLHRGGGWDPRRRAGFGGCKRNQWLIREGGLDRSQQLGEDDNLAFDAQVLLLRADLRSSPFPTRRAALAALEYALTAEIAFLGPWHPLGPLAARAGLPVPDIDRPEAVRRAGLLQEALRDKPIDEPSAPVIGELLAGLES